MRRFLLPITAGLVVGVPVMLVVQWRLDQEDTLGFGGPIFGLVAWGCGLVAGLGVALVLWVVLHARGGRK